jgi:hypothetical protein
MRLLREAMRAELSHDVEADGDAAAWYRGALVVV